MGERTFVAAATDRYGKPFRTLRLRLLAEVAGKDPVDSRCVAQIAGQPIAQEPLGWFEAAPIDGLVLIGEEKEKILLLVAEEQLERI